MQPTIATSHAGRGSLSVVLVPIVLALLLGLAPEAIAQTRPGAVIEEILVTARLREERLIDTPVAASVLSAEGIERYNTRSFVQLTERIPGLDIIESGGGGAGGNINIRGIGQPPGTADYGLDQPVSIVMDGMAFSRGHMLKSGFFDLEAVEVLKGPQALYFGKNSPAGVIALRSRTPDVGGEREAFVRAQYEFVTEDPTVEAGISLPVGEQFAFRLAGRYQDMQGGWLDNSAEPLDVSALYGEPMFARGPAWSDFPKQEQAVVRLTSVWQPNADFTATLRNFVSRTRRSDQAATILFSCAAGPDGNPFFVVFPDPTQDCPDRRARTIQNAALPPAEVAEANPFIDPDDRFYDKLNQDIHTLELVANLGDYTLTSITGLWNYTHREYTNYDWTSFAVVTSDQGESGDAFTQEFRLQSNFPGPFNFMVGGMYEDAQRELDAPVQILPAAFLPGISPYQAGQFPGDEIYDGTFLNYHQNWDNDIRSVSVYASFDWEFAERWRLTGGGRYTDEQRSAVGGNLFENGLGFSPSGVMYNPKVSASNFSPELTVSYHFADDVMGYASYRTGFLSGGISNPGTVPDLTALSPEQQNDALTVDEMTIEGFEIGLKGEFLNRRLRTEFAAFWYEAKDLHVGIFNSNTTTFTLQNAAVAHNWGIELQTQYSLTDSVELRFSGQFNHLEYDKWEDAGCHPVDGALPMAVLEARSAPDCHIGPEGAPIQDLSGQRYGGPPLQFNVGLSFDYPVLRDWNLSGTADVIYHSKGKRVLNQPFTEVPSRTVTNLSATLYQDGGPWSASLICSNCLNEKYVTFIGNKPLANMIPGERTDMTASMQPPRQVTLQLTYTAL